MKLKLKPDAEVWYCPNHDSLVLIKPEYSMVTLKTGFRVSYKNYSFWRSKKHLSKYIYVGPFEPSFEIPDGEDLKLTGTELVKIATDLQKVKLSSDPTPLLPKYDGKVEYSANNHTFWNGFTRGAIEAHDAQMKKNFKLNVVYDQPVIPKLRYRPYGFFEKLYNDLKTAISKTDPVTRDVLFLSLMMVLGIASLVALALVSNG